MNPPLSAVLFGEALADSAKLDPIAAITASAAPLAAPDGNEALAVLGRSGADVALVDLTGVIVYTNSRAERLGTHAGAYFGTEGRVEFMRRLDEVVLSGDEWRSQSPIPDPG